MSIITPHYRTIQGLLQSQSFAIDEYQREYKWDKDNITELLSDLQGKFLSSYASGDETKKVSTYEEYFLGSIIVTNRNSKNYLIDGQQRVTSLTLLLIWLYRTAKDRNLTVVQTIAPLIFSDNLGQPQFNLDIPERLPVIDALFHGKAFTPDGKDESIRSMYERYKEIEQNDFLLELGDALPHFAYWLMTRVGLIEISSNNDNYAYAIFETMNDRGKPLSLVDMLKAYLLVPVQDSQQRQKANDVWKKQVLNLITWNDIHEAERDATCIKAWLRAQYASTMRERKSGAKDKDWELIGSAFHRWVRDNQKRLQLGTEQSNMAMMTADFPFFAKAYVRILDVSLKYQKGWEAVYYNAHNDFTWQNTVLLAPLVTTDDDETMRRKIAVTATYLDIWLMRRAVNYVRVGYSSVAYAMWLLCRDIRRKSLGELVEILSQKLADDEVTFDGYPSKDRTGLDGLVLNQFTRRYIFHLLARISAYVDEQSGRAAAFDKFVDRTVKNPFDIEHIWCDDYARHRHIFSSEKDFIEGRNHVASLLLLPADVNRSLQDKLFKDKGPHYAKQNVYAASLTASMYQHQPQFAAFQKRCNLLFKPYATFGIQEQAERRELLKALVNLVWSPDRLKEAVQ